MIKRNIHIVIARSSIAELSSMSLESCNAIFAVLSENYERVSVFTINTKQDIDSLIILKPDLVFMGMKFVPSNPSLGRDDPDKIWLAQHFDQAGIAYTGSNTFAHMLELEKPLAKQRIIDAGLKTAKFKVISLGEAANLNDSDIEYPVFIKPTNRGGGQGIDSYSVASNLTQLQAKVAAIATDYKADSIIEEYLDGREFSVGILRQLNSDAFDVMPIELVANQDENGSRILSSQVKCENSEVVTMVNDLILRARINKLALGVFNALGASDYGRIDIRLDCSGTPNFLEANLVPSLISGYGSFPKASLMNIDLDYESMIIRIVELALSRDTEIVDLDELASEIIDTVLV